MEIVFNWLKWKHYLLNKQTKKKMKHYKIETAKLFSLVLVRYKNCPFQQEDFDLPTFAMSVASWDTTNWIVDVIDFFCSNL